MIYLDNIIIYSDLKKEHEKHVKWVLEKLHNENIPVIIKKNTSFTPKRLVLQDLLLNQNKLVQT